VLTVERNRTPASSGLEIFGTRLVYNPLGAVTAMQRGRLTSDGRTATFAPDESVTKTQVYDTLGRRVTNNDPDAGTYRYAYDPLDRLIATRDARGVVNRYWYDRGGRLVAEDLGGEVAYEPGSWSTYGGASGTTCEIGYDYVPNPSQTCFDVVYGFDGPYSPRSQDWESSIPTSVPSCASTSQGPVAGRPSWTRDRSGTVVLGYDCHGWAIWSVRQVFPDLTAGHLSLSTFDEAQRLLLETNPDGSAMSFAYSQRGMLRTAWFEEVGETAAMPLVDNATYDVQGRILSSLRTNSRSSAKVGPMNSSCSTP
jgi:YD repeat-containing protein